MKESTEFDFILKCLKLKDESKEINFSINKKVDWVKFQDLLQMHGVLPQVYKNIKERNINVIPAKVRSKLKDVFLLNVSRNIQLSNE